MRYHPDRHEGQDLAGRAEAERRMQAVNAAWAVLGDHGARDAYDAELGLLAEPVPDDPRRRSPAVAGPVGVRATLRRFAPVLIVVALLAAIFVFTAYAGPAPS